MSQQLAHSSQQLLVLLLLLLPRKTSSSLIIYDGGRRRVHLAEVSVMVYALLVCCIVFFIFPHRCHSHSLTLDQRPRGPTNSPLRKVDVFTYPYWQQRLSSPYSWLPRRPLWNQLEVQNCLSGSVPKDILSAEEVLAHEQAIQRAAESQRYLRRTQRILRLQHLQWLSHREFLASFGKAPERRFRRRFVSAVTEGLGMTTTTKMLTVMAKMETVPPVFSETVAAPSTLVDTTTFTVSPPTATISDQTFTIEASQEGALATVHRLAIRSKTIFISSGVMSARLRYLIQLHRTFRGQHRLLVEVRLHPQYPPIYIGTVEDVCAYWPADAPGSGCSPRKRRFYQKGRICLCHMPPGIYHQRLKINFRDVFEGAQISQFLINILFSGQHLNLYVTVQLISATNTTVACSRSKIPVSFSSL
ncbi:hypothetical protein ECG_01533 [Echinococcus granulosus]|uniref:DUF5739 domain-containing protein n=1 Tax=Echinococcus granulosus TaxID=6210 RepID=A0A068WD50_ECHGR|nr:hypothetical protein ECG_01533 [Echinococcus granulosus]CDS15538.1 hypothetical protein EgrG_000793600 [Echinococcus granulosus]